MFIDAKIKCNKDHTPYRIYINDELITERFYTIMPGEDTVSNDLHIELEDADEYDIKVQSLTDEEVKLLLFFKYKGNKNEVVNNLIHKFLLGDTVSEHRLRDSFGYSNDDLEELKAQMELG